MTDSASRNESTRALIRLSFPIGLAMISTFLFQVVDTYFVGQLGSRQLAALGFSATVYLLLVALFMGAAVAVSSVAGHALGKNAPGEARVTVNVGLLAGFVVASALSGLGAITLNPFFRLLGADPALLPLIDEYMSTIYLGMPLLIVGLVGDAGLRAARDTKTPAWIMGIAGMINVVFDYLLIFGHGPFPQWGIFGAALATVISWVFVAVAMLTSLRHRDLLSADLRGARSKLVQLGSLAGPAVATQVLLPITGLTVTFLAARHGEEVVAAFAVASRIEALLLVGITAVSVAIVPFVARARGESSTDKVDAAISFSGKASVYWGFAVFLVMMLAGEQIMGWFSSEAKLIEHGLSYFRWVAISFSAYGLTLMAGSLFNAAFLPRLSFRVLAVKTFLFTIPAAFVGSAFSASGIFAGLSLGNFAGAAYAALLIKRHRQALGAHPGQHVVADFVSDFRPAPHH